MTLPIEVEQRIRRLALENSIAHPDGARSGPILSRLLGSDATLRSRASEVKFAIEATLVAVARMSSEDQRAELVALGGAEAAPARPHQAESMGTFPDLPGAVDGHVVLRLAPFPSGALHIGNARMLYVNDHYRRRYHGRLLLVFDDTVGSKEKRIAPELFDVIRHDLDIANVPPDEVLYKSDRLPVVYDWARRVIDAGGAYVCVCPTELLQKRRALGEPCPERAQTLAETRDGWARMLDGGFATGEAVLRLRTDLADPDPAFRDRVLCRLSDLDHPRVGRKWRVWPMLEFSWAVDDVELGITHVLRGKDLVMEDRMEEFVWRLLGVKGPPFLHWGLLRVAEAKISKSKGYAQVQSGEYDGWADPRLWSLDSLERRGISAEALRRFTLGFGMSLADIEVPAETLYAENRQVLDPTTPRRSFVPDPIAVDVVGYPTELAEVDLPNHPERSELGTRSVAGGPLFWLAGSDVRAHLGEVVRLKDHANIELPREMPPEGPLVASFTSRENRRLPRLQWVGAVHAVTVDLLDPDGTHRKGLGERTLRGAAPSDIFQFERVGFVRVEPDWIPGTEPLRVCFGHV
ncbi:MAG: glutamate--tRNA ligase [Thermoplasmata archaeon]|nr:glutamate--tRNA ligase [Thermoplasmata archaeon]MCI4360025.1 glutamate--tRNA ligase [Thermoplasmata archaeon]